MTAKKIKTTPFDPSAYLGSDAAIIAYLDEALEIGDPAFIADAIGVVARARGMTKIAADTGLGRESLYKALNVEGNPELGTILRVLRALGLRLTVAPVAAETTVS